MVKKGKKGKKKNKSHSIKKTKVEDLKKTKTPTSLSIFPDKSPQLQEKGSLQD